MGDMGMNRDSIPTRRRGKGEMGDMGMNRDSILSQGEVRERWENLGMNRDSIPTRQPVREGSHEHPRVLVLWVSRSITDIYHCYLKQNIIIKNKNSLLTRSNEFYFKKINK